MIATLFINAAFFLLCIVIASFTIYYFQIKEYRFDRLLAAIKEQGLIYFLLPERFLFPKKSVRNVNIFLITLLLLCGYFVIVVSAKLGIFLTLLSSLAAIMFVTLGVVLTEFISQKNRNKVIAIAKGKRLKSNAVFIGITGSFGKSSTKEFLYQVISSFYSTGKTMGNYNTNIGVAMSINQNLRDDTQYFITEMGAYKKGEINAIAEWIKPTYAIITGLSNQHLSLFESIENLVQAKGELIESLPTGASVYINSDCLEYKNILRYSQGKNVILYSAFNRNADVFLEEFDPQNGIIKAKIIYKNTSFDLETHLKGKHNFVNLLPVIALSHDLNVPKEKIQEAINHLTNLFGKLSMHSNFIYDGYSSNITGFLAAIEVLASYKDKKKVIVTKGILELGKQKNESYIKVLELATKYDIKLITSDGLFKRLDLKNLVTYIKSENNILDFINSNKDDNSEILIEGRFSDRFVSALGIHE